MKSSEKSTQIEDYILSLKNRRKQDYAVQFAICIMTNQSPEGLSQQGLPLKTLRAIDRKLIKLFNNHIHVYRPFSLGDNPFDPMRCRICGKVQDGWKALYTDAPLTRKEWDNYVCYQLPEK